MCLDLKYMKISTLIPLESVHVVFTEHRETFQHHLLSESLDRD